MIVYSKGTPPRRGAYPVRSEGPSPNRGYRYWNGERWGRLCRTYRDALKVKDTARRSQIVYPVLWGRRIQGNG